MSPIEQARGLYANEYTPRQIAELMGVGEITVRRWCGVRDRARANSLPLWIRLPVRVIAPVIAWAIVKVKAIGSLLWQLAKSGFRYSAPAQFFRLDGDRSCERRMFEKSWHDHDASDALTPLELLILKEESCG